LANDISVVERATKEWNKAATIGADAAFNIEKIAILEEKLKASEDKAFIIKAQYFSLLGGWEKQCKEVMALLEGKVQLLEAERGDMVVRHTGERELLERERGEAHEAHDAKLEDTNCRIERLKAVCRAVQRRLMHRISELESIVEANLAIITSL